ncbi:MAG: TlpA family protein disulfide reductase [Tannerellaceae bacterium]|nr:TlpA family protein disulfide reductase [Tannerellaceae bacterium]
MSGILPINARQSFDKKQLPGSVFIPGENMVLSGCIKEYNPEGTLKTGMIQLFNDLTMENQPLIIEVELDGCFEVEIPLTHPKVMSISFDRRFIYFYGEPGLTTSMVIDPQDFEDAERSGDRLYKFRRTEYQGSLARINKELILTDLPAMTPDVFQEYMQKVDFTGFWQAMEDIRRQQHDSLQVLAGNLLPEVVDMLKVKIDQEAAMTLMNFELYTRKTRQESIPEGYFDSLAALDWDNVYMLTPVNFLIFINRFAYILVFNEIYEQLGFPGDISQLNISAEVLIEMWQMRDSVMVNHLGIEESFLSEIMKTQIVGSFLKGSSQDDAKTVLAYLAETLKDPFLQLEVKRLYDIQYLEPVDDLPEGKGADLFRQIVEPYRGKYLLVDFWGAFCGPCFKSIREMKNTRERLKDDPGMAFIFITADNETPRERYESFVAEQALEHSFYLSADEYRYLRQLFRFNGIPRYLFIDPDGRIVDDNYNPKKFEEDVMRLKEK